MHFLEGKLLILLGLYVFSDRLLKWCWVLFQLSMAPIVIKVKNMFSIIILSSSLRIWLDLINGIEWESLDWKLIILKGYLCYKTFFCSKLALDVWLMYFFIWMKNNVSFSRYLDFCVFVKCMDLKICDIIINIAK